MQASAPYAIAPAELIVVFYKNEYKRQKQTSTISKEEFCSTRTGYGVLAANPKNA
ncbi:hypothetical protein JP0566_03170 [Helicobacter pylori]|nr:hypothetical protein JP0050_04550 [Helicobacter pylori]GHQ39091.1 hypothetical protein JP0067_03500 [Helicobacter pylori]GHQ89477.1 hypothetical protein JP0085_03180 [Helicobacter pylori]GHS17171.1 hypothetical protein JP0117_04980 [Helicobacter pylori]